MDEPRVEQGTPVGRRVVLGMLGLGALGVAFGDRLATAQERLTAGLQLRDPTGLTQLIPAGSGFRYYSVTGRVPRVADDAYRLSVFGLVSNARELSLDDLAALPQTNLVRDFQCVTGWRVSDVEWSGVLLRDLLDVVQPDQGATALRIGSFDGAYTESLTMEQARRDDVLIATSMLGAAVTHDHGGPVRLYVAPMYGYKSLKWLDRIEVTDEVDPGYWEERGYDIDAWIGRSNGRDDEPV